MDFKIKAFKDLDQEEWDHWVLKISESNFYHSWGWLDYLGKFENIKVLTRKLNNFLNV